MTLHYNQNIILRNTVPIHIFKKLKEVVQEKNKEFNTQLAGNIVREEDISQHIPLVQDFLKQSITMYGPFNEISGEFLRGKIMKDQRVNVVLQSLWINHMKQYEFNPIHKHFGHFSFIIFMQVPFDGEEMRKASPGLNSRENQSGALTFYHKGSKYPVDFFTEEHLLPDRKWEGNCLIFPAYLYHSVYPFYGTEETRVTISGNIYMDPVE